MTQKRLRRRDFVRVTVVSAVGVAAAPLGCSTDDDPGDPDHDEPDGGGPTTDGHETVFPQGLASGDPKPDSVILWTRVEPAEDGDPSEDAEVRYEVAKDEDFDDVVASGDADALADDDHTVRVKVTGLSAYTTYYYRFTTRNTRTLTGRTKTAPEPDQDVNVRFAFATCQDFVGRYYHAWKALLEEDPVDFVVFLGDYIYETDGDPSFMTPGEESRSVVLPDGLSLHESADSTKAAVTLADYRYLYKRYRSDATLQEVHRLYPFVCIWDDHEFANDCWSEHTTHFSDAQGDEANPEQRVFADQAWFEYQPADIEFDASAGYPNDIKIYRKLRFGAHMELFMTDQRYFRDDHVIPEGPPDLDVAKITTNSEIGARIFVLKSGFDVKEAEKKPTMLGAAQKTWFVDSVKASDATWKVWGSETQTSQMLADLSSFTQLGGFADRFYLTVDQWDGYRTERAEILGALKDVSNLAIIVGDIHGFYASEIYVDFDDLAAEPVATEFTTAGITSYAIAPAAGNVLASDPTLSGLGLLELIPRFDELLIQGSPHYKYANSVSNGIAVCDLSAEQMDVTFLVMRDVTDPAATGERERIKLRTTAGSRRIEQV